MNFTLIIKELICYKCDKFYMVLLKYVYDFWIMVHYSQVNAYLRYQ